MVSQVAAAGLTLPAVMLARGLVGLGEGVALPAMNNLVANNIPPSRRSTALGGCFTGFHSGVSCSCRLSAAQMLAWYLKTTSCMQRCLFDNVK